MNAPPMNGTNKLDMTHGTGYRAPLTLRSLAACQLRSSLISMQATEADMLTLKTTVLEGCQSETPSNGPINTKDNHTVCEQTHVQLFHTYSSIPTASPKEVSRRRHPLQPSLKQPSSPHAVAAQAMCWRQLCARPV